MPELPDVTVYIEALERRVRGKRLERVKLLNPFILRTAVPPISQAEGKRVTGIRRVGKRIVLELEGPLYLVLHLMIAGRLRWLEPKERPPGRITLALLEFENGTLAFTEAGTKRRASLHLLSTLAGLDPGGAEVFAIDKGDFATRLRRENHTVKRALTDPHLFAATRAVLAEWVERLGTQSHGGFPEKVTAFRPEMAVHGRFGKPCPVCGAPVQRIVYAENECNYCARCQTGGVVLADRALSRLLHKSWPRSIDALE